MSDTAPAATLPATESEVAVLATQMGIHVPAACMPGVIANLVLLGRHVAILRDRGGTTE